MSKTPSKSVAKKKVHDQYEVLQRLTWHGIERTAGDKIQFAAKGSHANRDRWLEQGKIRLVNADGATSAIPQTVSAESSQPPTPASGDGDEDEVFDALGVAYNGQLESVPSGALWFIKRWGWDGKDTLRLYLLDRDVDPDDKRSKGFTGWHVGGCKRDPETGYVVATRSKNAEFRIPGISAPEPISQTPSVEVETIRQIPWMHIKASPYNPREDFDTTEASAAAMRELVDSIRELGIIQPLIVRPSGMVASQERFELVAGERRWRAAGQVGLETVPCLVRDLAKQTAIMQQALENIGRRDLNAIEKGEGYRTLKDEGGLTVAQISKKTGKSEPTIYSFLKLLDCPYGIRKAVIEGRVSASTADLVAREDDPVFRNACMDAILFGEPGQGEEGDGKVLSFRQTKAWIATNKPIFQVDHDWKMRQRASHAFPSAGKVLSVEESNAALLAGGHVRQSQEYVKPDDQCFDDPQKRTFKQLAEAAGVALPAPVLARDPGQGAPVVLLPREATQKALAAVLPEAGAYARRQQEEAARRDVERREAELRREEAAERIEGRAAAVVFAAMKEPASDGDASDEDLLRFGVGRVVYPLDDDDFAVALREMGYPVERHEEKTVGAFEWREEYLRGCNTRHLLAWLTWWAVRDTDGSTLYGVDEDRLWSAEVLLGLEQPRTSAVPHQEEVAA